MPYKDKLKQKESHRIWHLKNREKILLKQKLYQRHIKTKVFTKYSINNIIQCTCCGEKQIEFLCIDHINGGGTKHRAQIGSHRIYFWLINNNYPEGFRVLCHNCNQAFGFYGKCPHQEKSVRD